MKYRLIILWIFIAAVCAHDIYLSVKYADGLVFAEMNPIGQWLMNAGGVGCFLSVKWLANLVVLLVLILSHKSKPRFCTVATYVIAGVQAALLAVLWS